MNLIHKYYRYLFALIVGIALSINIITLKDGHNWGGDFSQYILHAQNIVNHQEYSSDIALEMPVVYPPGYPLLLSPIIKYAGINFVYLKLLNVFFWFFGIAFLYPIFIKRMSVSHAVLATLIMCFSSFFFTFKQNVISDIPFFFFISASLYFFKQFIEALEEGPSQDMQKRWYLLFFLITASWAFWIRSAGLIMFLAAGFYVIFIKRSYKAVGAIFLTSIFAFLWQTMIVGVHEGFFSYIGNNPLLFLKKSLMNFHLSFRSLVWFFIHPQTPVTQWIYNLLEKAMYVLAYLFTGMIFYYFGKGVLKKSLTFVGCFSFFYFLMLVVWSGFPHHPANFCRFLLPLIAPALIYMVERIDKPISIIHIKRKEKFTAISNYFLIALLVINLFNIYRNFDFNDDVLFQKQNQQLFRWVKNHLQEEDHYLIWQARPVRLMTGRTGAVPWKYQEGKNVKLSERMVSLHVSYLIALKGFDDRLIQLLDSHPTAMSVVWENEGYRIYKVISDK